MAVPVSGVPVSAAPSPALGAPTSVAPFPALPSPATAPGAVDAAYRLGPEDMLSIRVARHDEMSAEVTVLNDGTIMMPRVGQVQVANRTALEVRDLIVAGLKKTLLDPDVAVVIRTPRPQRVYVSGAVRQPGTLPMQPGWRISEVVAQAGGLVVKPERTRATLFRRPNQTIKLDLARIYIAQDLDANIPLEPGDNLDIQEEPTTRVYVSGAVLKAGPVELPKGGGITEAISLAGGVTEHAAASRTLVQRLSGQSVPVDMDRVLNHGQAAPAISLESGDQIIVPENRSRIAVLGQVQRPGPFPLPDGVTVTVAEAISLAGGPDKRARTSHIGLIRVVNGKSTVIPIDLKNVLKTGNADQNVGLEDGDIVYVPETDKPDWTKILPGAQALGSLWYFLHH
jgi:polysaccharide export outer membrane protein